MDGRRDRRGARRTGTGHRAVPRRPSLRAGGALAVISTEHVAGGTLQFFADVQDYYERGDPATPPGLRLEPADTIPRDGGEIDASGRFGPVGFHRYEWDASYTSDEYVGLLRTYSGHRALEPARQTGLLDSIAALIDTGYAGRITKRYLTQLALAHRR